MKTETEALEPSVEETARICAGAVMLDFDELSNDGYAGHLSKAYWLLIARAVWAQAPALRAELLDFHNHTIDQGWHDCDGIPGGCPVLTVLALSVPALQAELSICGYCNRWASKPCGEGCYWQASPETAA